MRIGKACIRTFEGKTCKLDGGKRKVKKSKEEGGNKYDRTDRKYEGSNRCIYVKGSGKTEYVRHKGEFMSVRRYERECKR